MARKLFSSLIETLSKFAFTKMLVPYRALVSFLFKFSVAMFMVFRRVVAGTKRGKMCVSCVTRLILLLIG